MEEDNNAQNKLSKNPNEDILLGKSEMKRLGFDENTDLSLLFRKRSKAPMPDIGDDIILPQEQALNEDSFNSEETKRKHKSRRKKLVKIKSHNKITPSSNELPILEKIPSEIHSYLNKCLSLLKYPSFPVLVTNKQNKSVSLGLLNKQNETKTHYDFYDSEKGSLSLKKQDYTVKALFLILMENPKQNLESPSRLSFCSGTTSYTNGKVSDKGHFLLYAKMQKPIYLTKSGVPKLYFILNNTENTNLLELNTGKENKKENVIFFNYKNFYRKVFDNNFNKVKDEFIMSLQNVLSEFLEHKVELIRSKTVNLKADIFKLCELYKKFDDHIFKASLPASEVLEKKKENEVEETPKESKEIKIKEAPNELIDIEEEPLEKQTKMPAINLRPRKALMPLIMPEIETPLETEYPNELVKPARSTKSTKLDKEEKPIKPRSRRITLNKPTLKEPIIRKTPKSPRLQQIQNYTCVKCQKTFTEDQTPYLKVGSVFCCISCFRCSHVSESCCTFCLTNSLYIYNYCTICFTSKLNISANPPIIAESLESCSLCKNPIHLNCLLYVNQLNEDKYKCATCYLEKIVVPFFNKEEKHALSHIFSINSDSYTILTSIEAELKQKLENKKLHYKSIERVSLTLQNFFTRVKGTKPILNLSDNWLNYSMSFVPSLERKITNFELINNPVCSVCSSGFCKPTQQIQCSYCCEYYHSFCINVAENINRKIDKWACPECAVCIICQKEENEHLLVACDTCDTYIHLYCHTPMLDAIPPESFNCFTCSYCKTCGKYATEENYKYWIGKKQCNNCAASESQNKHFCKKYCIECVFNNKNNENLNEKIGELTRLIKQKLNRIKLMERPSNNILPNSLNNNENNKLLRNDNRKCVFCFVEGDNTRTEDRLVLLSFKEAWAHLNCIIWSVGLNKEGRLSPDPLKGILSNEIKEGKRSLVSNQIKLGQCLICKGDNASVSCAHKNCENIYHFNCAYYFKETTTTNPINFKVPDKTNEENVKKCFFSMNLELFCPDHHPIDRNIREIFINGENYKNIFIRKNFVLDLGSEKLSDLIGNTEGVINFGNLVIESLGDFGNSIVDGSGIILTDGFKSRRVFTFCKNLEKVNKVCECKIRISEGNAIFEIDVEGNKLSDRNIENLYKDFIKYAREKGKESHKLQTRQYYSKAFGLNGYHLMGIGFSEIQEVLNGKINRFEKLNNG